MVIGEQQTARNDWRKVLRLGYRERMIARSFWFGLRALTGVVFTLMVAMLVSMPARAQDTLKGVALVIGQSQYEHITDLPNPAQDARDIAKLLTDLGFDARSVSDRDAARLARDLERFVEDAEDADVAFLYYAGHGIEAGGENWLIPVDADNSALADARARLIPMSEVVKKLQQTVPVSVVLLDACRTNPFPPDAGLKLTPTGSAQPIAAGGLTVVRGAVSMTSNSAANDNLGSVVGFAAEPGKPALDGEAGKNSPYAAALIRHLTAMKGAEFGQVMRMVTEEVYLNTKTQQRPWINESLRRFLYFGVAPEEPTGADGQITGERRQLLLTIADLPDVKRAQVETVALQDGVPLDALYGVLRAMGDDKTPENPEELNKALEQQAGVLKKLLSDRDALRSDDPQTQTLLASADRAIDEGAIQTARSFLDQAVERVEATRDVVDDAEALIKQKRIADAAIYAKRAEASTLVFEYAAAASDYAKAYDLIEKWDEKLRWNYKNLQAESLGKQGQAHADAAALDAAIAAYQQVIDSIPRSDDGRDLAITNNNLATIYETMGDRATDFEALNKALELYRGSLAYFEKTADWVNWSAAQNNIGNVLSKLGARQGDNALIEESIAAHRSALARRDPEKNAYDWSSSQNNLGLALYTLGERRGGGTLHDEAEAAYRQALTSWTKEKHPAEWAMAKNNLGNTLNAIGNERADTARFDEAAQAFRDALTVRTRANSPVAWASSQLNLGTSLYYAAKFSPSTASLQEASDALAAALEVFTRENLPLDWASVTNNRGSVLQLLGQRSMDAGLVQQSVDEFASTREVYSREKFPLDWAMSYLNAGNSLQLLAGMKNDPKLYEEAITSFREALKEYTREKTPEQWALLQANVGSALQMLSNTTGDVAQLNESIAARRAALEVLTFDSSRIDWANAQSGLGMSLNNLGLRENTTKYAAEAESAFTETLKVFTEDAQPIQWAFVQSNIGDVYWNKGVIGKDKSALERSLNFFADARRGFEKGGGPQMIELLDKKSALVKDQMSKM